MTMPGPTPADILAASRALREPLIEFLCDLVRIPSLSGDEERVVQRVAEEMEAAGFAEIRLDGLGNVLGRVGDGPRVLACDAHLDTVGPGDLDQWTFDPYGGEISFGRVYGRGAVDQKAGMAAMVYAGRLLRELDLARGAQVWMVGSVMEEDCDGLCWHYILQEGVLRPEVVLATEPTGLILTRGQRGRLEIRAAASGRSCHGSAPERGDNAIYKLAPAVPALAALHGRLARDEFLGPGSLAVTWIGSSSPSLCAVPDRCELHIDRRLTAGEDRDLALAQVREALAAAGVAAELAVPRYDATSWRGLVYPMEKYYPTWTVPADHPAVRAGEAAHAGLFGHPPAVGRWTFSTNGVAIRGLHGVPCIGFGPGREEQAHAPDEYVPIDDVVAACAFYAAFPDAYLGVNG